MVLRHRRLLVGLPVAIAIITGVTVLLLPRQYSTELSFEPQASTLSSSQLVGLAAQFGVSLPGGISGPTPDYYAAILGSAEILRPVAENKYAVVINGDTVRGSFVDLNEKYIKLIHNPFSDTYGDHLRDAIDELTDDIDISSSTTTGLVQVTVTTRWPDLTLAVSNKIVALVNALDTRQRSEQADAESQFIEARIRESQAALRTAEDQLQAFMLANRAYQTDPSSAFQYDRLSREVTMRQTLYTSLSQSYEQAHLDAVRNTPTVTVAERPELPLVHDKRHTVLKALLGFVLGLLIATFIALGAEVLRRNRKGDAGDELERLLEETRRDALRIIRPFAKRAAPAS